MFVCSNSINNNAIKIKNSSPDFLPRRLMEPVKKWIDHREIYAIKGPRQSGKTTLLKMLQQYLINEKEISPENIIFLTFEDREILEKFSSDPKDYIKSFIGKRKKERFYFFLDEFHYLDDGGQKLKLLYDIYENIKFVITGSSSLEITGKTAKFLVGRIFSFHLFQFSFAEFIRVKSSQLSNVYMERAENSGEFIFHLKSDESGSEDLYSFKGNMSKVQNNALFRFSFPKIEDSKKKRYLFYLEVPQAQPGNAITIWSNREKVSISQ